MVSSKFLRKKTRLFKQLKKSSELAEELEQAIVDAYGSRGKRAIKAIKSGGVRKHGDRWFVRGKEREYEVVQSYCTCYDFVLNVVTGKVDVDMCYHGLAKKICELLGTC